MPYEEVMSVWITVTQYGNLNQFANFFKILHWRLLLNIFPVVPVFS